MVKEMCENIYHLSPTKNHKQNYTDANQIVVLISELPFPNLCCTSSLERLDHINITEIILHITRPETQGN